MPSRSTTNVVRSQPQIHVVLATPCVIAEKFETNVMTRKSLILKENLAAQI